MSSHRGTAAPENALAGAQLDAFLAEPREAALATLRPDGDPHVTPVWFLAQGRRVLFCLESRRAHLQHLRARPRASLLVHHEGPPARAASLRGAVELVDDEAAVERARALLTARYYGAPAPRRPGLRYTLCILTPEETLAWDFGRG